MQFSFSRYSLCLRSSACFIAVLNNGRNVQQSPSTGKKRKHESCHPTRKEPSAKIAAEMGHYQGIKVGFPVKPIIQPSATGFDYSFMLLSRNISRHEHCARRVLSRKGLDLSRSHLPRARRGGLRALIRRTRSRTQKSSHRWGIIRVADGLPRKANSPAVFNSF